MQHHRRTVILWSLAGLTALAGVGCVSLDTAAPRLTQPGGESHAAGRTLYIGRCARCHAVEPVTDYSAAEWAEILPDMADRTKLNAAETETLRRYIAAVLTLPPAG